ncbi:hypothetical protein [Leptospira bandrabouensis]|uniref:hypothetical protein n=1 Tax=Leptospira bandrabouensis TaxID=2484903 RepID=UPI001EE90199|nr:hypothetical protein [Leptospira bandrabouensis]MCG6146481.1 hypothetical protein [Leptospira bandrabouensis]MCG6161853.1 hypothetical protein [Leptospira bandrabouensis]MCG6166096.1 hypothetical protein [Leptospira bandrabouensis]
MSKSEFTKFEKQSVENTKQNLDKFLQTVDKIAKSKKTENKDLLSNDFDFKNVFAEFTKVLGFCTDIKGGYVNVRKNLPDLKYATFQPTSNSHLFGLILGHYQSRLLKPAYNSEIIAMSKRWEDLKIQLFETKTRNNLSLRENFNSNILCIDIDTHDLNNHDIYRNHRIVHKNDYYRDLIQYLYHKLEVHPILCQISKLHRGIYLYYQTDVIRNKEKTKLFDHIKETIYEFDKEYHCSKSSKKRRREYKNITGVELRTSKHLNRLPLSFDYTVVDENFKEVRKIFKIFKLVANKVGNHILKYDSIKICNYTEKDFNISDEEIKKLLVDSYSDDSEENGKQFNIWSRPYNSKIKCSQIKVPIESGNKNKGLFKLAYLFHLSDKSHDHQSFYNLVCNNNESSSDVSTWFDYHETEKQNNSKNIKKEIDWIPNYYGHIAMEGILKGSKDFLESSSSLLQRKNHKYDKLINHITLNSYDEKLCKTIINELKPKFCKKYPFSYLEKIVPEIISKIKYEANNPRIISKEAKLKKETKLKLQKGTQFPRRFQDLVKEKYKLKCDQYKMFNIVLKSTIFNQLFTTKRGYLYGSLGGSCRQFTIDEEYLQKINIINKEIFKESRVELTLEESNFSSPQYFILCESASNNKLQKNIIYDSLIIDS